MGNSASRRGPLTFLQTPCARGAELDLGKAFDSIAHEIAYSAGASHRTVLDCMRHLVWNGAVHGEAESLLSTWVFKFSSYRVEAPIFRFLRLVLITLGSPPRASVEAHFVLISRWGPLLGLTVKLQSLGFCFLSYVLGPWFKIVRGVPGMDAFLYMDVKSLVDNAKPPSLDAALRPLLALGPPNNSSKGAPEARRITPRVPPRTLT